MKALFRKVKNSFLKSKTLIFSLLLTVLGVVELNFSVLQEVLGEHYGVSFIIISIITAVLRVLTTTSLSDKNERQL